MNGNPLLSLCCEPRSGASLGDAEVARWLKEIPGWEWRAEQKAIARAFHFADFHATMAFVNAVAGIAHREEHHPDLEVGYNRCVVRFSTHSVGGLSLNDFICAAQINALRS